MLTYLINVTGDLLALAVICGIIFAFIDCRCPETGRVIIRISLGFGFLCSGVRAYITNTRRLVGGWKVGAYGYGAALAFFVLLIIAFIIFGKRFFSAEPGKKKTAEIIIAVLTGLLMAAFMFGALPNVYVYPFKFDTGDNGILSTDFLFRLGGYLLGIIISVLGAVAAYKVARVADKKGIKKPVTTAFFFLITIYSVNVFAKLMLVLTPRKIIDSIPLFNFAAASNNNSRLYTYAAFAAVLIIAVIIWIKSHTLKEPYETNAQHRKQKALWRSGKRWSVPVLVCFIVAILCSTWFVELNTVVIREAPVEEPVLILDSEGNESELQVPLEMVEDGHLHRFGYTTPEGNPTRFIVVLKQEGTTNYGVGLDACEICGEAGYYENNDGQVVCKKCNVVMNKTTIGMKGGCNPIIIDYDITESYITVPVSEMINNQNRFKK